MTTRTRFVFLMHPKEFKHEKAATGRLTHLCLSQSRIISGVGFDENEEVRELIEDPANFPVLLYPGREAVNLSPPPPLRPAPRIRWPASGPTSAGARSPFSCSMRLGPWGGRCCG